MFLTYDCIVLTCKIGKNKCFKQECVFFFTRDRSKTAILFLTILLGVKMCVFNSDILEVALIECMPWSHCKKIGKYLRRIRYCIEKNTLQSISENCSL